MSFFDGFAFEVGRIGARGALLLVLIVVAVVWVAVEEIRLWWRRRAGT